MSVSRRLLNLLTVWLPLLFMGWQLVLEFTVPENVLANLMSESGPHEFIQFLVITLAFLLAVWILLAERGRLGPWERTWIALAAICSLYVSCEEVSWGQHLLQWQTPEYWARINDQDETNLHNTSSWLDQKPRIAL